MPFGAMALLISGLLPVLLGYLEAEHRISPSGIGLAASVEGLAIALSASLGGLFLEARHLRRTALLSSVTLIAANLSIYFLTQQPAILASRAIAGVAEGVMFWISVGMVARTTTTELWGALINLGGTAGALVLTLAATTLIVPAYGVNGVFAATAVIGALCVGFVWVMPDNYPPLPHSTDAGRLPPARGCVALLGSTLFSAATLGLFIYLLPLAHQIGLDASAGDRAVNALLIGQLAGGAVATASAGRIGFRAALGIASLAFVATWATFTLHPVAWLFVAAAAANGFVTFFAMPFLYPLAVEADDSLRAAVQSGPAQLLGVSVGSLASAWAVDRFGVEAVPYSCGVLLLLAIVLFVALQLTTPAVVRRSDVVMLKR
jgi:predicted MFS family arabinose efflux permease